VVFIFIVSIISSTSQKQDYKTLKKALRQITAKWRFQDSATKSQFLNSSYRVKINVKLSVAI